MPSDEQHNHLRIHLLKKFNWTRIGTIYLTKAKYTLVTLFFFYIFYRKKKLKEFIEIIIFVKQ